MTETTALIPETGNGRRSPFEGGRGMSIVHMKLQLRRLYPRIGSNRFPALDKEGLGVVGPGIGEHDL
ncbi:hypothetical protein [Pontibacter sp. HSC-36F09]|uniref:hypothetical protein n=1 Tax=Pontibacter sp. HSC-36F09 TaxID=2910966 RepID=UPI0020A0D543|nr:hypothetical protein [Pontibacter sp. HSC-36F09]MCP2044033.1 hypothetical protein [Pontibacter sp. HSC-36F09]